MSRKTQHQQALREACESRHTYVMKYDKDTAKLNEVEPYQSKLVEYPDNDEYSPFKLSHIF